MLQEFENSPPKTVEVELLMAPGGEGKEVGQLLRTLIATLLMGAPPHQMNRAPKEVQDGAATSCRLLSHPPRSGLP